MKLEKLSLKKLKVHYEDVCNEYIRRFCEKQELEFDGWIGDEVGGIASFVSQYFFTIDDIILDLHTKQPKGLILDWQSDGVDYNMFNETPENINYKSYTMGLRYEDLKKQRCMIKMTEPILIKAGDHRLKLGVNEMPPDVDCRVIEENNYQTLKRAANLPIIGSSQVFEHYGKPFTNGRDLWDFLTVNYNFVKKQ